MKQYRWLLMVIGTFVIFFGILSFLGTKGFAAFDEEFPETKVLTYIASRENVPVEYLEIAYVTQTHFELLGKDYWAVKVDDHENHQTYGVWVDMQDSSFVDNVETLQQAEKEAHHAIYGKLEVSLWELLQDMGDADEVIVAIWVTGEPTISQEEIYVDLAAKYPEVQEALERTGNLDWLEVDDPDLINEIENAYTEILVRDIQARIQPLVDDLEAQGYIVQKFNLLPSVVVSLPKRVILDIALRSDVGSIGRADQPVETQLDTAVPSSDVPVVWERGFNGTGIDIGIVEPGRIDFTPSGNFLIQGNARTCTYPYGPPNHKTFVASVAGSSYSGLNGVAPGAEIDDACADTSLPADVVVALEWAMTTSDPINASVGVNNANALHFLDKAFDYYASIPTDLGDTIVVAAGNPDTCPQMYVKSPGKAWNVITVGGYDEATNYQGGPINWGDDLAYGCYVNPDDNDPSSSDREKPEVVASGVNITAIGVNEDGTPAPNVYELDGTSFATPQVTGIAALLMDRHSSLLTAPVAVKAIIMASAIHNIEGSSRLSDYDGAGGVAAAVGDSIAVTRGTNDTNPCTVQCWWYQSITPSSFTNNNLSRYFNAIQGDKIRVVITWFSNAYCPDENNCTLDHLDTDLDLSIYNPSGSYVTGSTSFDNNYEIVEFVAATTGKYQIEVHKYTFNEADNKLGIAWTTVPMIAGGYDDPPSGPANYVGTWTSNSGWSRSYLNTVSYSNVINDKAIFTFTGERITRIYTMASNRGLANIYIDGVFQNTLNDSSTYARWQVGKTWSLPFGTHTIEVRNNTGGPNGHTDLDAFIVDIPYVGSNTYDDGASQFNYIPPLPSTWTNSCCLASAYNQTLHWSKTPQDAVTFTFYGDSITYVYTKAANRGKAAITIDGENKPDLDLYSATTLWQQQKTYPLSLGVHTIHISVSGQKNNSSSDIYVDIDALIVP